MLSLISTCRRSRKHFPRMNERIAEHGVLHQPEAERQDNQLRHARRNLGIHDDETAAGPKLVPHISQHGTMMRHGVERQAEQNGIERLRRDVFGGVAFGQCDVVPAIVVAELVAPCAACREKYRRRRCGRTVQPRRGDAENSGRCRSRCRARCRRGSVPTIVPRSSQDSTAQKTADRITVSDLQYDHTAC